MAKTVGNSELEDIWASSGTVVEPDLSKKEVGWQLGERPPHEYMNYIHNLLGGKMNHVMRHGISLWNASDTYEIDDIKKSTVDGNIYRAIAQNSNDEPSVTPASWERIGFTEAEIAVLVATYESDLSFAADTRIAARNAGAGAGVVQELTLSQVLDFVGSAARGDTLMRGAASWAKLVPGASGLFLQSAGAGADLLYAQTPKLNVVSASRDMDAASGDQDITGFGFNPRAVIFFAACPSIAGVMSVGVFAGGVQGCVRCEHQPSGAGFFGTAANLVYLFPAAAQSYVGTASFITDGIRISWVRGGTPDGDVTLKILGIG